MKKLILALTILALASCAPDMLLDNTAQGSAQGTEKALGDTVTLLRANSETISPYGITSVSRYFYIKVKNLSSTKTVSVWHSQADGTWKDIPASFYQAAEAGYEIWYASTGYNSQYQTTNPNGNAFCIKMVANGTTYWDNNGGKNYVLGQHGGEILGKGINVLLANAYTYKAYNTGKGHFYGNIDIRNVYPTKKVTIVYTLDSWQTTKTAAATYNPSWNPSYGASIPSPNAQGIENWTFDIDTNATAFTAQFAIKYEVNGQTYWDNNGGLNYTSVIRF